MEHGTVSMYNAHKCRCDLCVTATRKFEREYMKQYRKTEHGKAKLLRNQRFHHKKAQLATLWIKEHRPDVWAEIVKQAESIVSNKRKAG